MVRCIAVIRLIEGAKVFVDWLLEQKQDVSVFDEQCDAYEREQNVAHMEKLGYRGIESRHFLYQRYGSLLVMWQSKADLRRAYVIGMDGLKEALETEGFQIVDRDAGFCLRRTG